MLAAPRPHVAAAAGDQDHRTGWETATLGLVAGSAVIGILAGQSWARLSRLTIQTVQTVGTGTGGQVSFTARF